MQAPRDGDDVAREAGPRLGDPDAQAAEESSFVTRNCWEEADRARHALDSYARGMREGCDPYIPTARMDQEEGTAVYGLGEVVAMVTRVQLLQAVEPEALGYARGKDLKARYLRRMHARVNGPACARTLDDPGQGVGLPTVTVAMQDLSTVLHELAGTASMCWTQPPDGTFDRDRAMWAVQRALERLAPPSPWARTDRRD